MIAELPAEQRAEIEQTIAEVMAAGPSLAMVDSDRGITNLHVPSDIIIDASMPAMIRQSGQMWDADGQHPGLQGRDPRLLLRRRVRGSDRGLQGERRLRPGDDGIGAQRRV